MLQHTNATVSNNAMHTDVDPMGYIANGYGHVR